MQGTHIPELKGNMKHVQKDECSYLLLLGKICKREDLDLIHPPEEYVIN